MVGRAAKGGLISRQQNFIIAVTTASAESKPCSVNVTSSNGRSLVVREIQLALFGTEDQVDVNALTPRRARRCFSRVEGHAK